MSYRATCHPSYLTLEPFRLCSDDSQVPIMSFFSLPHVVDLSSFL